MPVYHPLGQELVSRDEFLTRVAEVEPAAFDVTDVPAGEGVRPFANIEFGKPLNILIRRVYTGKYPEKRLLNSRKPMLITSAIRMSHNVGSRSSRQCVEAVGHASIGILRS